MKNSMESPSIYISINNPEEPLLNEVLAGIEEEGIPYFKMECNSFKEYEENLIEYAYNASLESRIGIAIAISGRRIILHYNKLNVNKPIIDVELKDGELMKARVIGCNAARLYKRIPFKPLENFTEIQNKMSDEEVEITKTVLKILKKKGISL